ncbi:hypothetical protein [Gilliamella intestini]|uniref:Uncharacterized protein n=1 Tax=Gilliamella intestini TaxID=1798183 RepID=A0A1C4D0D3_9GAMM|nr:hypothetical protein [Gilliamella intestini]SCC24741.1 hypothetical protein GA0061080_105510 [Gilliamella intestini]
MKQLILLFLLLPNLLLAQEVYTNASYQEYLSLGSTENGKQNFLNLKNGMIDWINLSELQKMQQTDMLSPHNFWDTVNKNSIGFYANGYEPFWNAKITKNKLQFISLKEKDINIDIDIKNSSLTRNFVVIFHSKNGVYGLIRSLPKGDFCEANLDEVTSIYEIFIDYKGEIFEGCAYLDKL